MAAPSTLLDFLDALDGIDIVGVINQNAPPPPGQWDTDKKPFKFVDQWGQDNEPLYRGRVGGGITLRARVVVVLSPVSQGENEGRWDVGRRVIAALNTGIEGISLVSRKVSWSSQLDMNFENSGFAAVYAEVEAS